MKITNLIPFLVMLPAVVNAEVVLTSQEDNLLVNGNQVKLIGNIYDANGVKQENIRIIDLEANDADVIITINNQEGLIELRADGYHQAHIDNPIYNANCELIGVQKFSFYDVDYIADGATNIGEVSNFTVYKLSNNTVNGYNDNFGSGDCSSATPVTGYAIEESAELTTALNDYMNGLAFPLSVKFK